MYDQRWRRTWRRWRGAAGGPVSPAGGAPGLDPEAGRGLRPLGIPTVRDRIVQTALRFVLEPIFEREFAAHSYGFRPGRGARTRCAGCSTCFGQAPRGSWTPTSSGFRQHPARAAAGARGDAGQRRPGAGPARRVPDAAIMRGWSSGRLRAGPRKARSSVRCWPTSISIRWTTVAAAGFEMVRYADDFVVLCRSAAEAQRALALVARGRRRLG